MASRNIVQEILEIQARSGRDAAVAIFGGFELNDILKRADQDGDPVLKLIPVRAVALIESFFRGAVASCIDAGPPFVERAAKLFEGKTDFRTALALHGQQVTVGQLVAHGLPFSRLAHIASGLDTILDLAFFDAVSSVHDRWEVEVEKKKPVPILGDKKLWYPVLEDMFVERHMLAHEASRRQAITLSKAAGFVDVAVNFLKASYELFTNTLHPNYPLTQTDMNIAAGGSYNAARDELQQLIVRVERRINTQHPNFKDRELQLFRECNATFEAYRNAEMTFIHDPEGGGTIGPLIRAGHGERLIRQRIPLLVGWLEEAERLGGPIEDDRSSLNDA